MSVVLIAEKISAKRHSLIWLVKVMFTRYGARSRAPTIIRRTSVNATLSTKKKNPNDGVLFFVGGASVT